MIDNVGHLLTAHPTARVKAQGDGSLLGDRRIDCRLEISDRHRVLIAVQRLTGVIVWINKRQLPNQITNNKRVRIILHVINKAIHQIL